MKKRKVLGMLGIASLGVVLASCTNGSVVTPTTTITSTEKVETTTAQQATTTVENTTTEQATTTVETTTEADATTTTEEAREKMFSVKVVDFDGAVLLNAETSTKTYATVFDALSGLDKDFKYHETSYGITLDSIAKSLVDPNCSLMIYENGQMAQTGVSGLVIDDGDAFEFKVECWNTVASGWGTMDSYDLLVDEAIYYYAKHLMVENLGKSTSYKDSLYWDYTAMWMMLSNSYDANVFNTNYVNDTVKATLAAQDVTAFEKSADYAKWYYAGRLADVQNMAAFTDAYASYISNITSYEADQYSLPFVLSIAKELKVDENIQASVKNTEFRAATSWGPDTLAWQLSQMALYTTLADTELDAFTLDCVNLSWSKDISLALVLLPYAAMNKDAREKSFAGDKDIIEYLFDTYYNKETHQFESEKTDGGQFSNQIYASLMAYKVQRDKKKAVTLFA